MRQVLVDPIAARLDKLRTYYLHFNVFVRYGLTFKQFVAKVDNGTWVAYKAPVVAE